METIFVLLIALFVLDLAAHKWGFNSRDDSNSPEWERREQFYAPLE